ncbi:MAG: prephenate dehydrogenase/arogenate dehydrogenase family protein [Acidobacteriota bacterium]
MARRVLIVGTGLIGASIGLALKAGGFDGEVLAWDANAAELAKAVEIGAIDRALTEREVLTPDVADVYVLATPVLPILDWMKKLAAVAGEGKLVTDVGSTKQEIARMAVELYNQPGRARFLPGHPMAGKESGGAALAEAGLFRGATWLFTPVDANEGAIEAEWRTLVEGFGARVKDLDAERHDEVCAWVSHLPQFLSTALAAMLEDLFATDAEGMAAIQAIGGRALRETTRLGASPYSMWRDIALTNTDNVAATLLALEQRLAHVRENLKTPELREEFRTANRFRARRD